MEKSKTVQKKEYDFRVMRPDFKYKLSLFCVILNERIVIFL